MTERPHEGGCVRNRWCALGGGASLIAAMGCVSPPPSQDAQRAAETWTVEHIIRVAESTEQHEENVDVRNCTHAEHQGLSCEGAAATMVSAGVGTGIAAEVGGSILGAHVSGAIETQALRELGLTYQRSLGRQYALEPGAPGTVRTYKVVYEFKVLRAQAAVRSTSGRRQQLTHPFAVSCEIRADPVSEVACLPAASSAEGNPRELGAGADPGDHNESTALATSGSAVTGAAAAPAAAVAVATPDPSWQYVTIPANTEIEVQLSDRLGTDLNRQEDPFEATLAKDLKAGPVRLRKRETTVRGVITEMLVPGRVKGKATLCVRLTALRFGSLELPVNTSKVKREVSSQGKDWLRRGIGVALGAGVGAAAGGRKGAAVGGGAGLVAAEGTNMIDRGDHLVLTPGERLKFKLLAPLQIPVRRLP